MLSWLINLFYRRPLNSVLNDTKVVYLKRVKFRIKKINALNYLDGSKVLRQVYEQYKVGKDNPLSEDQTEKRLREHISHVICGAVVNPKITFKKEDNSVCIDDLFVDWDLCLNLYNEIMNFTYGKKKL